MTILCNGPATKTLPALCVATALLLTGCSSTLDRLSGIGKQPELSKITNPTTKADYEPVSLPMPTPEPELRMANSLWSANRQTFFKDQRARKVGDILTVSIKVKDDAELKNDTTRTRNQNETAGLPNFLGYDAAQLGNILPETVDPANLVDATSTSGHTGSGKIKREDTINLRLAAVVTQVLPNGNLVISGRQEIRVNFDNRILELAGVIRPEDITMENSVPYDKIAEARIGYGGEGQVMDVQQPRYGQQLYDVIFPF